VAVYSPGGCDQMASFGSRCASKALTSMRVAGFNKPNTSQTKQIRTILNKGRNSTTRIQTSTKPVCMVEESSLSARAKITRRNMQRIQKASLTKIARGTIMDALVGISTAPSVVIFDDDGT